ncbi:DUF2508 family protein [Microaerobacter geothermalis]|uniref:DUF2508 family protein n=1 Tax=Microaerobacter geothermalis TaxID=674972 RepID=UPI001F336E78|nr:DUF2508 family protein [Microaerobacter geothermalis]MCF6095245.1 DUF2508 family protein [Microaerobacter geothermalis]
MAFFNKEHPLFEQEKKHLLEEIHQAQRDWKKFESSLRLLMDDDLDKTYYIPLLQRRYEFLLKQYKNTLK